MELGCIALVRHGETNDAANRVVQSHLSPINKAGSEQAKQAALLLRSFKVGSIYSSDHLRAIQTANIINFELKCGIHSCVLLRERNMGQFCGMPYDSFRASDVRKLASKFGAESLEEFERRCRILWRILIHRQLQSTTDTVVVSHLHVIESLKLFAINSVIPFAVVCEAEECRNGSITTLKRKLL